VTRAADLHANRLPRSASGLVPGVSLAFNYGLLGVALAPTDKVQTLDRGRKAAALWAKLSDSHHLPLRSVQSSGTACDPGGAG